MRKSLKLISAAALAVGLLVLLSACAEYREKRAPCASLEVTGQIIPCHAPQKINLAVWWPISPPPRPFNG